MPPTAVAPTSESPASESPSRFRRAGFAVLLVLHLAAVLVPILTGVSWGALALCAVLYALQMFGVTAGYHRYFAHRSFETGRVMRTALAFLSLSSLQRPILWWAAKHRDHHRFSDTAADQHSPVVHGALRSHLTWSFYADADHALSHVNDLRRFPEVVWLDRWWRLPFAVLAIGCYALLGWQGVFVGLVWSTLLVYHLTGCINSIAHTFGTRRYATSDDSRNNPWLAVATFGEGWHNNHHHYPSSCRQGFFWWELDLTWLGLRALERLGLVWNLRSPPHTLTGRSPPGRPTPRAASSRSR